MRSVCRALLLAGCAVGTARGHGAMIWPPTRNGVDRTLSPWNGPTPDPAPPVEDHHGWCTAPDREGKPSGVSGQACYWFSNGCSIGCDACDGTSRGPVPNWGPEWRRKFNTCNSTTARATVCDRAYRTVNVDVECGADDDWYYYSPWRAPGLAPVFDSCGRAGGHAPPDGQFGGIYVNTTNAKLGDMGSKVLPRMAPGVTWAAGDVVEVSWTIQANHGGGYIYRLAPADGPLDEAAFNKIPLTFAGKQQLRYGGKKGIVVDVKPRYLSEGTVPTGSQWVMNPIPRNDVNQTGTGFPPPCDEAALGVVCHGLMDGQSSIPNMEIVDYVRIPADIPPGAYVLGWRWDCEESNQIWSSCSDVRITRADPAAYPRDA